MNTVTSSSFTNYFNVTSNISTTAATTWIPAWIRIATLACMILIDITAFVGSLLVICAFLRTRRLQTVTNYFIASLAIADALVAIFVLPLSIYHYQHNLLWKLGLVLCDLWVSFDVLLCTSSILNLTCISVDRYMAITKPLTYTAYRSKFLARIMILLVWVVSAIIACPPIFGWRDKNRRQKVEQEYKCDLNTTRGYVIYSALGSFYIPGVIMIFVYMRIFMIVHDRKKLVKEFCVNNRSLNASTKSNPNDYLNNTHISIAKKSGGRIPPWCCYHLRKRYQESQPSEKSLSHYSLDHHSAIQQKNDRYLTYRFTNNNNNKHNTSRNSDINSPIQNRRPTPTISIVCHLSKNRRKELSNISDDIYQYRCNYLSNIAAGCQLDNDDSPCYELETSENFLFSPIKHRSSLFEQSMSSKICTLNIKAARVPAASISAATNANNELKQENDIEHSILLSNENDSGSLLSSINETLKQTSQSWDELTQLSNRQSMSMYKKNSLQQMNIIPMRETATANSSIMPQNCPNSSMYLDLMRSQPLSEPIRTNWRIKAACLVKNSPTSSLVENSQQHRVKDDESIASIESSKSSSMIKHFTNQNTNSNETNVNRKRSWCCCYLSSVSGLYRTRTKKLFHSTILNHSLTNDDDKNNEDKVSFNDANRTPVYTPVRSLNLSSRNASSRRALDDTHGRERIRFMKEQKTAKTLAIVVGGFIVLWLPFFVMYIIPPEKHLLNVHAVTLITWLGYFNSVINPFIYAYCSKQFRTAFWNTTFGVCIKRTSGLLPMKDENRQLRKHRINL